MHSKDNIVIRDGPLKKGKKVLVMIHGRGGSASDILSLSGLLNTHQYVKIAPQAEGNTWYPYSFMADRSANEPWLSGALSLLGEVVKEITESGVSVRDIFFLGFSQGACLMTEFLARNAMPYGGAVAFTGGLIGETVNREGYSGDFGKMPFFIGSSDPDHHVPVSRIEESVAVLESLNAVVIKKIYPNMGHTIVQDEIDLSNHYVFGQPKT